MPTSQLHSIIFIYKPNIVQALKAEEAHESIVSMSVSIAPMAIVMALVLVIVMALVLVIIMAVVRALGRLLRSHHWGTWGSGTSLMGTTPS